MDTFNYIASFFLNAGMIQGIFLAAILLSLKKGNPRSNRVLAVLLLVFSISIAHLILFSEVLRLPFHRGLKINEPFQFLIGPLIYLYVLTITKPLYRFSWKELRHFIPFIGFTLIIIPINSIHQWGPLYSFISRRSGVITTAAWALILLHVTIYILHSVHQIKMHENKLKDNYSDFGKISERWLKFLIYSLLILYLLYFVILAILIHIVQLENPFSYFQKIISVLLSLALYGLGYHGLRNSLIFTFEKNETEEKSSIEEDNSTNIPKIQKYERSGMEGTEIDEIANRLLSFMEEKKPYLNSELTLPELSGMLDISRNRLSQVLNEKLGCNFYDFVSGYRIKQVQQWMVDPKMQHLKILALALDAGFNSKAAFNQVFKKNVGMTPSEYRKSMEINQ